MSTVNRHGDLLSGEVSRPALEFPKTADLSASKRSEQMDATVKQVTALTVRVNEQTQAIKALRTDLAACRVRLTDTEAIAAVRHRRTATFWKRLVWLVRG